MKKYNHQDILDDIYGSPVIEIDDLENIFAHYYDDMSGEIAIIDEDGENIFFKDDGKLKHHIEYLNEEIKVLEKAYKKNVKLFKKAISLLKKEQKKHSRKKTK